jgi:hypothetical protein
MLVEQNQQKQKNLVAKNLETEKSSKKTVAKIISLKATKTKIVVTENAITQIAVAQQIIVHLHYHLC